MNIAQKDMLYNVLVALIAKATESKDVQKVADEGANAIIKALEAIQ